MTGFTLRPPFLHASRLLPPVLIAVLKTSWASMPRTMLAPVEQFQILQSIVRTVTVAVMDVFMAFQASTDSLLHHNAVFSSVLVRANKQKSVAVPFILSGAATHSVTVMPVDKSARVSADRSGSPISLRGDGGLLPAATFTQAASGLWWTRYNAPSLLTGACRRRAMSREDFRSSVLMMRFERNLLAASAGT